MKTIFIGITEDELDHSILTSAYKKALRIEF